MSLAIMVVVRTYALQWDQLHMLAYALLELSSMMLATPPASQLKIATSVAALANAFRNRRDAMAPKIARISVTNKIARMQSNMFHVALMNSPAMTDSSASNAAQGTFQTLTELSNILKLLFILCFRCNLNIDCEDGSDEKDCKTYNKDTKCHQNQFMCSDGKCIDSNSLCDGFKVS